jgi:hypothetical protein
MRNDNNLGETISDVIIIGQLFILLGVMFYKAFSFAL